MEVLGIDVGGSGIKGAIVDLKSGKLLTERIRYVTPKSATPYAIARTIARISSRLRWKGIIGVGFPAVIKKNVALTATNVSNSWIGTDAGSVFSEATGCQVTVLNDADAVAIAECKYGNRKLKRGLVIFVTVGTGLGTALLHNGKLIPNTELGHLYIKNMGYAETKAADSARKRNNHTWKGWASRFNLYLEELDNLLQPDLFVIGGGVSKRADEFMHYMTVKTPIKMASLMNEAGIVGAALAASQHVSPDVLKKGIKL